MEKVILSFLTNFLLNGNIVFYQMSPTFYASLLVMNRNNFKTTALLLQSNLMMLAISNIANGILRTWLLLSLR